MGEKECYEINIQQEFACLAADCPMTCCKNWNILYDADSYRRAVTLKGSLGDRLRLFSSYDRELGAYSIRTVFGRCPHYRKKLCGIQCEGHEECMPQVCRLYPRRTVSYGARVESFLELACVHAAEILMLHKGELFLVPAEAEPEIFWEQKNSDEAFLKFLLEDRQKLVDYWWKHCGYRADFTEGMREIYRYAYAEYMLIIRNRSEEAYALKLPLEEAVDPELAAPRIGRKKLSFAFYPVRFMNELIFTVLEDRTLRFRNPELWHLIGRYRKHFGKVLEEEAEVTLIGRYESMIEECPELHDAVCTYYAYLLMETYCESYEDYYLLGPVLLAGLLTEFYMIFLVVAYLDEGKPGIRRQAEILSCLEKSLRHKNSLEETFLQRIRDTYYTLA